MNLSFKPLLLAGLVLCVEAALAQEAAIFAGADQALGQQLIEDKKCAACHAVKFGGDGSGIYRPGARIKTAKALRSMVEQCNTELSMHLFPDEVTAIAAVLNARHYQFR